MFVKRDFVAMYKQTILGPIWFLIQPILTTILFAIVFGKFGGFKTNGQPTLLFYFSGILLWNYFSETFIKTSTVFRDHAGLYGKVYFPRLLTPLSISISGIIRCLIQYVLFILMLLWYCCAQKNMFVHPNWYVLLTPFLFLMTAGLALGLGLIVSSLTSRYRDLIFLLSFGVQLLMFASPVIYSVYNLPKKYSTLIKFNPLSGILETFRLAYLGDNAFSWVLLLYSFTVMLFLLIIGFFVFSKTEKTFMDTV